MAGLVGLLQLYFAVSKKTDPCTLGVHLLSHSEWKGIQPVVRRFDWARARFIATSWAWLGMVTAGCVKAPPTPELAPSLVVLDQWNAETPSSGDPVLTGWIATFQDPQLDKLVEEVLENNQDLRSVAAQLDASRHLARRAGAELYPLVALDGSGSSFGGYEGGDVSNRSGISLDVIWELDVWGRIRSGKAAATADYQAAMADYNFARLSLAGQTAKAWFQAIESNLQEQLSENTVALFERNEQIVEARFDAGLVSRLDIIIARAQLATEREKLEQAKSATEQAVRSLEILLGRYPAAEMELAKDLDATLPPVAAGIPSEILERRPDLVAAERAVASAFYTISEAKAARLPSISLTGSTGSASSALIEILSLPNPFWSLAASLFAPLFTGGALQANVDIATSQHQAVLAQFSRTALQAFAEIETALANEEFLKRAVSYQESVVAEASEAARLAAIQYDVGLIDFLSVIQLQEALVDAQRLSLTLREGRLANRVNLHLSLGGDF